MTRRQLLRFGALAAVAPRLEAQASGVTVYDSVTYFCEVCHRPIVFCWPCSLTWPPDECRSPQCRECWERGGPE